MEKERKTRKDSAKVRPADASCYRRSTKPQKDPDTYFRTHAGSPLAGCGFSAGLALLVCGHGCSADAAVSSRAFAPPETSSYTVTPTEEAVEAGDEASGSSRPVAVTLSSSVPAAAPDVKISCTVRLLRTMRKNEIVVFHFRCSGTRRCTLLWSHSNAADCGLIFARVAAIAERLHVDIIMYDYSGYGCSTGQPSELDLYADILAVYEHIVRIKADHDLVLYGNSIGSAPTLWLAAQLSSSIGSVVLHAPFASGISAMLPPSALGGCCAPSRVFGTCNPFDNRRRIRKVCCPVLVLHGTDDQTFGSEQSTDLHENIPETFRREGGVVLIQGAGHDNMTEYDAYFDTLLEFLPVKRYRESEANAETVSA